MKADPVTAGSSEFVSKVLHDLAQPLTALECGLELGLLQDKTAAEFRDRMQKLLEAAHVLHTRMLELRGMPCAANLNVSFSRPAATDSRGPAKKLRESRPAATTTRG